MRQLCAKFCFASNRDKLFRGSARQCAAIQEFHSRVCSRCKCQFRCLRRRSTACLLTRAKPFDVSIKRRSLRRNTALSDGYRRRGNSAVSPSFSSSSCAQTQIQFKELSQCRAIPWSEFDRGGVAVSSASSDDGNGTIGFPKTCLCGVQER